MAARDRPEQNLEENSHHIAAGDSPDGGRHQHIACGTRPHARPRHARPGRAMHGGHRASPCATLAHGGRPVRNTLRWPARGPRPETRILRQSALEELTKFPRTESPRKDDRNKSDHGGGAAVEGRRP
ncbi:hypothetical protein F511_31072 [Dorcoceras hygrometricum]|uniref:Uncharacterized protein n=1 Tax=Dorcoceras hygrometricum TaxID=472368 RepID=A0A2Z7AN37_9LAMI|nr:hypothetical protein F511_31072 [Dorcoceras hygrometricum]